MIADKLANDNKHSDCSLPQCNVITDLAVATGAYITIVLDHKI